MYYKVVVELATFMLSDRSLMAGGDWHINKEGDMTIWTSLVSCSEKLLRW
jgi:hypothetical protein